LKKDLDIDIVHSQGVESLFCDVVTMHNCHKAWIKYYGSWNLNNKIRSIFNFVNTIILNIKKKVVENSKK